MFSDASFAYQEGIFADPVPLTRPFSAKPGLGPPCNLASERGQGPVFEELQLDQARSIGTPPHSG